MTPLRRRLVRLLALSSLLWAACGTPPGDEPDLGSDDAAGDTREPDAGDAADTPESSDAGDTTDSADAADAPMVDLDWSTCHSDYECSDVSVPLDYDSPGGEQISLRVIRKTAENPDDKIGTVMLNFGGPGASGVSLAANDLFPLLPVAFSSVHERFDVVVVEPRGAAASSPPVDCVDGTYLDEMREVDAMPDDSSGWDALSAAWEGFAEGCLENHTREYLAEMNTVNHVRDMETVRRALDESKINFVGISYGTYVGALYANMYPDRVRAFVLDSNMGPERLNWADHIGKGAGQFREGLLGFFDRCGGDDTCKFHGGEGASSVESALAELFDDLEASPLELDDGRTVSALDATMALASALRAGAFDQLAQALTDAESGNGQGLMDLADAFWMRDTDGNYGHFVQSYITTMLADSSCPDDLDREALQSIRAEAADQRPFLGRMEVALAHACTAWPDVGDGSPDIRATDAPPMLIVNAEGDPATPMANAEALQSTLANGSHLLRWEGRKHGVITESACTREVVDQFMVDPDSAPDKTTCSD